MGKRGPSIAIAVLIVTAIQAPGVVADCNSPPTAVDDATSTYHEPVLIDVLANDSDVDGQALAVTITGGTCLAVGTATVDFELVRFVPDTFLETECLLIYSVTDEGGLSDQGTITIAVDDPTIFTDDFESGNFSAWTDCETQCE